MTCSRTLQRSLPTPPNSSLLAMPSEKPSSPAIRTCASAAAARLPRRDFETVREFEFAIRQALQGVSEDALTAFDNTFEMARTVAKRWVLSIRMWRCKPSTAWRVKSLTQAILSAEVFIGLCWRIAPRWAAVFFTSEG